MNTPMKGTLSMSDGHSVTAVVTAYNAERFLERCIRSIIDQTACGVQIIVVDDGSTDATAEVALSFGDRIKLVRLAGNQGPAVGRTTGLMAAHTDYIAFLDADDYWRPAFVETCLDFLRRHPAVIAVSTGNCKQDWDGTQYMRPDLDDPDRCYYGDKGNVCPDFYAFWSKYKAVLTGTVMMRTRIARQTGGQRADLRLTQDLEFWGYLATFGPWAFIPKPLFVTDLQVLTPGERLRKFKRRFTFFRELTVSSWSRRIRSRLRGGASRQEFEVFLGHIATLITWANAYTFRLRKSYRLAKEWDTRLDKGLGSVLRWGTLIGPLGWPLVCLLLRIREVLKSYAVLFRRRRGTHAMRCIPGTNQGQLLTQGQRISSR